MTPERGDVLHLIFDPIEGREMRGERFCLVVSPRAFNAHLGLAWVCPISRGEAAGARDQGFLLSLSASGMRTDGNVHLHQLRALDWRARKARRVERAAESVIREAMLRLAAVLNDD
jgi:mRNA interferase ChpB